MKVIYIHQYFCTPEDGGAIRSYYLAKGMVNAGVEVEMITAHNKKFYDLKIIEGIRVHYLPVAYRQEWGFSMRVIAFLKFAIHAMRLVKKLPRPDYLYITSTPLTTGMIGLWAKRKFALPFIFEVRDLWPDAPVEVGAIRNPLLKSFLYRLEKRIYQHALKCVALSPGIANNMRKKTDTPITIIPNIADTEYFYPNQKSQIQLDKYGLSDQFTIIYSGAVGDVNAVHEFLELARHAESKNKPFQFVILGKGSKLEAMKSLASKLSLSNLKFFAFGSKEKVRELLDISDMAFISFEHLPVLKTNSPNKFFDAIAAGKAILINHKGWIYELCKENKIGLLYRNKSPENTLSEIERLIQTEEIKIYQKNARSLAVKYFDKEIAIQKLLHLIDPKRFPMDTSDAACIQIA
ncbi:glycosyltransferase family 4 protein [Belliella kenyensis]|uniref:Glycosyltransferase family 4 protein n=1 Tax=Belliella kenyensis TaxID=1472724 RepID=A0ABV8EPG9_9BACT|nr:glycosyltransferase family 4 protein [Belliella kenyensis]MCH7401556.1 glycosyltransferase family 4 protein [Belliella kenyensis]MDN3603164.1 glycosyltransferase family 4 protein [Belliella kenyensis]